LGAAAFGTALSGATSPCAAVPALPGAETVPAAPEPLLESWLDPLHPDSTAARASASPAAPSHLDRPPIVDLPASCGGATAAALHRFPDGDRDPVSIHLR